MNILGAGITGLVLGYLTDSPVYGEVIGGQLSGLPKGPRILQLDQNTIKLIRDLAIDEAPETFTIGYVTGEGEPIRNSLLDAERRSYYKKTRGQDEPSTSSMSGGKTKLVGWDINKIPLVEKLSSKVEVRPATVSAISFDKNAVYLTDKSNRRELILPLNECVSTISLRRTLPLLTNSVHEIFYLYNIGNKVMKSSTGIDRLDLTCFDTTFIRVDLSQDDILPFGSEYNYLYYTEEQVPLNRATRVGPSTYIFECRGDLFEEAVEFIEKHGWEVGLVETIRFCQLVHNHKLVSIGLDRPEYYANQLRLCGRFAQWDHSFKINSVFKEAENYV